MRICLYLDRARTFNWHLWLSEALTSAGNEVFIRYSPQEMPLPKSYSVLFNVEKLTYNLRHRATAIDPISLSALPQQNCWTEPFDVVVDLASDDTPLPYGQRILSPSYNSMPTILGAIAGLLGDEPLRIEVFDSNRMSPWVAYPAIADRNVLIHELDNVLSCTVGLLVKALATPLLQPLQAKAPSYHSNPTMIGSAYRFVGRNFASKAHRFLQILTKGHRTWAVAWRHDSMSLLDRGVAAFQVLPQKENHFYADPFPFRHRGNEYIFVEDFDHATGYASIAVSEIKGNLATTPRPVIHTGYHLSYPHVFAHQGEIWMVPESGDTHDTYIYRAVNFPDEWKCEGKLLSKIDGYDATLLLPHTTDQRVWLFVSERMWNSTGWDTLSIFYSDRLIDGKWVPHGAGNPLLLDAQFARSAGHIFQHDGQLVRPVQDCSQFYGGSVNLCQIDRLTETEFVQTRIGTIQCAAPDARPPFRGCHTYNFCDGLEVIDIFDRRIGQQVTAVYAPTTQQSTSLHNNSVFLLHSA